MNASRDWIRILCALVLLSTTRVAHAEAVESAIPPSWNVGVVGLAGPRPEVTDSTFGIPALRLGYHGADWELEGIVGYGLSRPSAERTHHTVTVRARLGRRLFASPHFRLSALLEVGYAGRFGREDSPTGVRTPRRRSFVAVVGLQPRVHPVPWLSFDMVLGVVYLLTGGTEQEGLEHAFAFAHPLATLGASAHW